MQALPLVETTKEGHSVACKCREKETRRQPLRNRVIYNMNTCRSVNSRIGRDQVGLVNGKVSRQSTVLIFPRPIQTRHQGVRAAFVSGNWATMTAWTPQIILVRTVGNDYGFLFILVRRFIGRGILVQKTDGGIVSLDVRCVQQHGLEIVHSTKGR